MDGSKSLTILIRTHGHSRPFLPELGRKNDASAIETHTSLAFHELSSRASPPSAITVTKALDHACQLTGIGPATGTLILSIFDPVHIPYFQDEMFEWFFPGSGKLKYTEKEYFHLSGVVRAVLGRLSVKAVELEKVTYVLGHMEVLGKEERKELEGSFTGGKKIEKKDGDAPEKIEDGKVAIGSDSRQAKKGWMEIASKKAPAETDNDNLQKQPPEPKKGRKRAAKDEDDPSELQEPRRQSQRKR